MIVVAATLSSAASAQSFSLEGLAGEWTRIGSTRQESTYLTIDAVTPKGFDFSLSAILELSGADTFRSGQIDGTAAVRAGTAIYLDDDTKCQVTFTRKGDRVVVATSPECAQMGGMGVRFHGEFRKRAPAAPLSR